MASKVTTDFKQAFALLLTILKVNFSTTVSLNYAEVLYEWTLAGLITNEVVEQVLENKVYVIKDKEEGKHYADAFVYAKKQYLEAIEKVKTDPTGGLKPWAQSEILKCCLEVNQTIFPIALSEGLLDLKDVATGIGAGAQNIPTQRDK